MIYIYTYICMYIYRERERALHMLFLSFLSGGLGRAGQGHFVNRRSRLILRMLESQRNHSNPFEELDRVDRS